MSMRFCRKQKALHFSSIKLSRKIIISQHSKNYNIFFIQGTPLAEALFRFVSVGIKKGIKKEAKILTSFLNYFFIIIP